MDGLHSAFALAMGDTFWVAVVAAALALGATLFVREVTLRGSQGTATAAGATEPVKESDEQVPAPGA